MSERKLYRDYFNINPKYYSSVTEDLIKQKKVEWKSFYPHETFVKLLEKVHIVLSGKDPRSLWVEGAYGTGKSHAALTVKSLLEALDEEIETYFEDFGLSKDLCQKIITDKNSGKLITIHRIGSGSIRSDQDLIWAIQDSIMAALKNHNIENRGESSLREATLKWLEKKANHDYFDLLISEDKYAWNFGGEHVDVVIDRLINGTDAQIAKVMRDIMMVAEDNGITALRLDIEGMAKWIKAIISENQISAMLFVWDEFTEFFQNNPNSLTGFQTLAEISLSHPFYFMIVSHESRSLFVNADAAKKILGRFVDPVKIELPENMAFRLMAQAMKETSDELLKKEWHQYRDDINAELTDVRNVITTSTKKSSVLGQKTLISNDELQAIVPIHPYAALMLKHLSVAFQSNQRSMFDFIINNDMEDSKAFKWFISNNGPLDDSSNILTVDMLWDFFYGKGQNGLNDDVRGILDSYGLLHPDKLTPDEQRVFKSVLLLQAISLRVSNVDLLRPNEQNVDLAFSGTDWTKGKGRSIAEKLCRDGLLFKKQVGGGKTEYTVANSTGDFATIEKYKQEVKNETKTQSLIVNADLISAVKFPASIKNRFIIDATAPDSYFTSAINKMANNSAVERFKTIIVFSLDDSEASNAKEQILKEISRKSDIFFIDASLTPMGKDLYTQYIENMAYSRYYAHGDKTRALGFERQAIQCLNEWKTKMENGAFMIYSSENASGLRMANLSALQDELCSMNHKIYYCGLEQFSVSDEMFMKGPVAQGAECGIKQELAGRFKSSNDKTSLATALSGAWKKEDYWKDSTKKSLPITRIKKEVERVVHEGFKNAAGRISILDIFDALEPPPYGFIPSNISAFVLGFVLKEYANADYFWSNGSNSEIMSLDKMKTMIANAINQKVTYNKNYKEEYIVIMSIEQRTFLHCTSKVFQIAEAQCGSIESARDQIRIKMRERSFPIWCIKSILNNCHIHCSSSKIETIIDAYCGIANTANSNKETESDLAEKIGKIVCSDMTIIDDLEILFTSPMCRKGMLAYIDTYQNGELKKLANEINDGGAYLDEVKAKFNADAANWVWNTVTADEKISDVILEYKIILESNKSLPKCITLKECTNEWNKKSNNIRMPYETVNKVVGDLGQFLQQLFYIKQSGNLQEQNKSKFYDMLVSQRDNFEGFYKNQTPYFKQVARAFIDDLEDSEIEKLYIDFPAGQFTKNATEYYKHVEDTVKYFIRNQAKKKLKDLWLEKTGTKDPFDWSATHQTPLMCMFDDATRGEARENFDIMRSNQPSEADVKRAIDYLANAEFYNILASEERRNQCFMERVVGEYSVLLTDPDEIREDLISHITDSPYYWMDNRTVLNQLHKYSEKKYKLGGCEKALSIIDRMNPEELKKYLRELVVGNLTVGMEIIKND